MVALARAPALIAALAALLGAAGPREVALAAGGQADSMPPCLC
jgi:hypothetical protein